MGDLVGATVGVLVGERVVGARVMGLVVGLTVPESNCRLESVGDTVSAVMGRESLAAEGATACSLLLV